jgi:hypothetical protein
MNRPSSRLYYANADEEVRLGDVIRVRRFLRRAQLATVSYIPGISPRHPDIEYDDVRQWAYTMEDGRIYLMGYCPERVQPSRRICFVRRGQESSIAPTEKLF